MRAETYERILGLLVKDKEFRRIYGRNPVAAVNKYKISVNRSEVEELTLHHKNN
jgi:hypothetical protein